MGLKDYHDSNHQTINNQTNMKTNLSRLPQLIIFAAITFLSITNLSAQVTVGSNIAPNKAALLDLKVKQDAATLGAAADDNNVTSESG
jgi:hypothetical protein